MTSSTRDRYADAAATARGVLERAARTKLSTKEHRVLEAVIARTALYSRLGDRCYLAQIAAHAHGVDRAEKWMLEKTRLALVALRDAGLIDYRPPKGRPPGDAGPSYYVELVGTAKDHPATGGDTEGTPPAVGWTSEGETPPDPVENTTRSRMETPPAGGGPREKTSEKAREQPAEHEVTEEARRRIERRRARGEDIGPGLERIITNDVRQELAAAANAPTRAEREAAEQHAAALALAQNWAGLYDTEAVFRSEVASSLSLENDSPAVDAAVAAWRELQPRQVVA